MLLHLSLVELFSITHALTLVTFITNPSLLFLPLPDPDQVPPDQVPPDQAGQVLSLFLNPTLLKLLRAPMMNKVVIFILWGVLSLVCDRARAQSVFAGTGYYTTVDSGDGSAATSAGLYYPRHIAADGNGNIYITTGNSGSSNSYSVKVRKVSSSGIISTYAGGSIDTSSYNSSGSATSTVFNEIFGLAVDSSNNLYISARLYSNNNLAHCVVRKVDFSSQQVSTYAGQVVSSNMNLNTCYSSGDGGNASSAYLNNNRGIAFDSSDNLYVAEGYRLRKITLGGIISTYAGNGGFSYSTSSLSSGVSYSPLSVSIDPYSVTVDSSNNVYFTDGYYYIRKISSGGSNMTNFVGNGRYNWNYNDTISSDGTSYALYNPVSSSTSGYLTNDGSNLYTYDKNQGILKISSSGYVTRYFREILLYGEYYLAFKSGFLYYSYSSEKYVYKYDPSASYSSYTSSSSSSSEPSTLSIITSYYNSNKQKVVALAASAAAVLTHIGLTAYLVSSERTTGDDGAADAAEEEM